MSGNQNINTNTGFNNSERNAFRAITGKSFNYCSNENVNFMSQPPKFDVDLLDNNLMEMETNLCKLMNDSEREYRNLFHSQQDNQLSGFLSK